MDAVAGLAGVDLNLLVAFDVLVAERSVTRAAERLSVGQPAMSATLARLRRLFDDPLLVRQGRHLMTTPLADSLVEPVRDALSSIEQTLWSTRPGFDPATDTRTFSIVASDYVTLVFLRPLLARLALEAPHVRLRLHPVTPDHGDRLRRNLVDLLIMPSDVLNAAPDLPSSPLFTDRYMCAVGRDNPDIGDSISLDQFSTQPYLAYSSGVLASVAEQQLDAAGIPRNVEVTSESLVLAPHLLVGTRLLTLLHERLARAMPAPLDIRMLEPPMPLRPVTEVMSWAPRHDRDPAHAWLRRRLLHLAAEF